jgi:hypothetical protein
MAQVDLRTSSVLFRQQHAIGTHGQHDGLDGREAQDALHVHKLYHQVCMVSLDQ